MNGLLVFSCLKSSYFDLPNEEVQRDHVKHPLNFLHINSDVDAQYQE